MMGAEEQNQADEAADAGYDSVQCVVISPYSTL